MISTVFSTSVAYSSDYQRCFNEEKARIIISELVERDSLLVEVRLLEDQIEMYEQRELDFEKMESVLANQRDHLLSLTERTDQLLAEVQAHQEKSFCDSRMCKFAVISASVVLTGFTTYLIVREVR